MRAVVQRVTRAEVRVDGVAVGAIGAGLAILLGVGRGDGDAQADRMAARLARLRVFPDADGRFDRSLLDTGGAALVDQPVHALRRQLARQPPELRRGGSRRSSRSRSTSASASAWPAEGVSPVERGRFGAHMQVELVNDGPVTIVVEL